MYPAFQLGRPQHEQDSFLGRLRHFVGIIDPSTLFVSEERLRACVKLLDDFKEDKLPPGVSDRQLWEAQKVKQAIIHPDTGEKIFMPFRMSGYVPFGTPIVIGLLLPNQTVVSTIIWQWLNQSHNACVNYANRNATKPTPTAKFLQGYVGAVTSAVSIAVGLKILIQKANKLKPATRLIIQRLVPFPAVACANICNVGLMRHTELAEGIDVLDSDGHVVGSSRIAAEHAIMETAFTRVVLPMPIFVLRFLQSHRRLLLPIHSLVCLVTFSLSLPLAISLFPQMSQIEASHLEPEITMATDCKGAEDNARRLSGQQDLSLPYPELCGVQVHRHQACPHCQVMYCSSECRQAAVDQYHRVLCLGSSHEDPDHPINKLKDAWRSMHYPPETSSITLMARMVAVVKQAKDKGQWQKLFSQFCSRTANEEEEIAHKLLGEKFRVKTGDFLNCEGSGLFLLQSSCNHSCIPNAEAAFPDNNFLLHLSALSDIQAGESRVKRAERGFALQSARGGGEGYTTHEYLEICISYLDCCQRDRSRHSRHKTLR
ncbi:hypothetical protein NHX12_011677 [Muraenolepis orangiensis]|uniref:Uncharacterized protein n=1 Tax=Muraenolepis orangiensis TaxID=630683 RepID=A0A9Q0DGM4_9TELE|nr:hypothetical protein NHX12_011677 [Muraenolepis orangiensis]